MPCHALPILVSVLALALSAHGDSPAEALLAPGRPLVIGHRGYASAAPENSIASFDRALSARVDLVELDYYHSSDGIPVVIHDGTLDRTTDAVARWGGKEIRIQTRTADELTQLEVGRWFRPPFPDQKLPTLARALDFIQARGMTLIERKAGDPATLIRLLDDKKLLNRVVVQSFDWAYLRDYHRLEPRQVLGALGPVGSRAGHKVSDTEKALNRAWLEEVRDVGARVAVWNNQVDAASVALAHELGLRVWVYTIDDPAEAARLLTMGIDGLITNNAAIGWRAVALRSAPVR